MARKRTLGTGKLPPRLLTRLLGSLRAKDSSVRIGPALGEDTAAISLGDQYLITKTDPITLTSKGAGALLVQVNANDLATRGCRPRYIQVVALFPPGTTAGDVRRLFGELSREARQRGVTITGGHTEITDAVTRPILVGDMIGFVPKRRLLSSAGARAGDVLVITAAAGIEGSAILADQCRRQIVETLGTRVWRETHRLGSKPGTSVTEAGLAAAEVGVHAMHDPTEGGVAAALHEMAYAARRRLIVDLDRIPVFPVTLRICRLFGIDPLGLISSGALLIAVAPSRVSRLIATLRSRRIDATAIGHFEKGRGVKALRGGRQVRLPWFERDELLKATLQSSKLSRPRHPS